MIIRVFEGGEGCTSGGRSERSRDSGDLEPELARERDGEGISTAIVFMVCILELYNSSVSVMLLCRSVVEGDVLKRRSLSYIRLRRPRHLRKRQCAAPTLRQAPSTTTACSLPRAFGHLGIALPPFQKSLTKLTTGLGGTRGEYPL